MDTVQIMISLVTLVLTYERTILRTTTDFFYFSYELFLCIIILNSVIGTLYCVINIIISINSMHTILPYMVDKLATCVCVTKCIVIY